MPARIVEDQDWWVGEAGDTFAMDAGSAQSGITGAVVTLEDPTGATKTPENSAGALSILDTTTRYYGFTVHADDFDVAGKWKAHLKLTGSGIVRFTVMIEFGVGQPLVAS